PSVRTCSTVAFSKAIMPISTACAWCTDMSRAKPASAECSSGTSGRAVTDPITKPSSRHATAARAPAMIFVVRGERRDSTIQSSRRPGEACRLLAHAVAQIERSVAAFGDAAAADGSGLDRRVLPKGIDKGVDPGVVGTVDLELVTPRLQRDRHVEARVRAHHHVRAVAHLAREHLNLIRWQVGPVGHPDGAVLEAVHGVLLGDRLGVDVTHAVLPGAVVVAAGRRVRLV